MKNAEELDAVVVVEHDGNPYDLRSKIRVFKATTKGSDMALDFFKGRVLSNRPSDCEVSLEEALEESYFQDPESDYTIYVVRSEKKR